MFEFAAIPADLDHGTDDLYQTLKSFIEELFLMGCYRENHERSAQEDGNIIWQEYVRELFNSNW